MSDDYTPTTEDIIRSFSIPTHRLVERGESESFSEYLSRVSIEGHGHRMESEAAAHRWLAAHDAEVRAAVLAEQGEPEGRRWFSAAYHHIQVVIDYGELHHRLVCTAPEDAPCRRRPADWVQEGQESWTDAEATVAGFPCWAVEWFEAVGAEDGITGADGVLGSVPVTIRYCEGVEIRPVADRTDGSGDGSR